ncbi:MAG: hypothetical protein ACPGYT_16000, partial [Nitrospirales bacterium]
MIVRSGFPSRWLGIVFGLIVFGPMSCASSTWETLPAEAQVPTSEVSLSSMLKPDPEDIPFFRVIAESQDKELKYCKSQVDCQKPHFLRGLASLYVNRNLAASHFRRVITAKPASR